MTESLKQDVQPSEFLFLDQYDRDRYQQYLWISSRGPRMHTHFDMDRNVFVQLVGEKIFTLFPPTVTDDMYIFPRLHPLWHKSQCSFENPSLARFPNYERAEA